MSLDPDKLAARIAGRKAAEALIQLHRGVLLCDLTHPEAVAAYLRELQEHFSPEKPAVPPMTDVEARRFAEDLMPFGKFKGQRIGDCDLEYLDWLVKENESFSRELARYMASDKVKEELRISLEISDRENLV